MRQFLRKRILEPLKQQLVQGVTPGQLALALALGLVIGSLPVLGVSSLLCAVVAVIFRLNQPAIQVANYLAYPVQLALFVPFFKAGAHLYSAPKLALSFAQLEAELSADLAGTMSRYATANLHAFTAWALVAPLGVALMFFALRFVLVRVRVPGAGAPPANP